MLKYKFTGRCLTLETSGSGNGKVNYYYHTSESMAKSR